jgi:hypothetical protein
VIALNQLRNSEEFPNMSNAINENSSVEEIEKLARKLISEARKHNWNVAADNLEYYLNGSGLTEHRLLIGKAKSFKLVRGRQIS